MTRSLLPSSFPLLLVISTFLLPFAADATPTGTLMRHLSNVLKWTTKSSPKTTQTDGEVLLFEGGYLVETLVEGDKLGVVPHTIRVSPEGELFAVDATNNNIVRITPPLSQYSRARLVAGSFQGYTGHVDGKPSEARFYHPKGVTMDDKGNVYVADTANLAIRKIGEAGVTTIAGGKSNVAGYMDGPSEDAKFSNDFDVVYVGRTCSLLVVDRGNAALRQISLQQEDCQHQYSTVSIPDVVMVIGAVLAGYVSCLLQHGFGYPTSPKTNEVSKSERHDSRSGDKPALVVESLEEEPSAGWPSFGRLLMDLFKFSIEAIGSAFLNLIPGCLRVGGKTGLTPLRDHLIMPEDKIEPPLVQKQKAPPPMSEKLYERTILNDTSMKPQKSSKLGKLKDPSLSNKHRSSKRQEYADFYSSTEAQLSSKGQLKERIRHRHRDKSGEVAFGAVGTEPKSVEMKPIDYDAKFDHYNIRSKYGPDSTFRF